MPRFLIITGTPKQPVENQLQRTDVLFDIDQQGTQQVKAKAREDMLLVFILPPSIAELERRLKKRGQDSAEVVARRMSKAAENVALS